MVSLAVIVPATVIKSNQQIQYLAMLAAAFPDLEIYAASVAKATAVGTALSIHHSWNTKPFPADLIKFTLFS